MGLGNNKETSGMDRDVFSFLQENESEILDSWSNVVGDSTMPYDYQKPGDGISKLITRGIKYFSEETVLDIGCNNGLNSIAASLVATRVIGCDYSEIYIRRAIAGKNYLATKKNVENLDFVCGDFSQYLYPSISGIFACRVLYHIGDDGVGKLSDFLNSKDKFTILVHTRPGRKFSRTKVYNGLIELIDIFRFLTDHKFNIVDEWGGKTQKVIVAKKGG